jgi:protein-L-isoaspartate(D-aspartate) O-methyltransferase
MGRYPGLSWVLLAVLVPVAWASSTGKSSGEERGEEPSRYSAMQEMIQAIQHDASLTATYTGVRAISEPVIAAMGAVPRDQFVPDGARTSAFENRPLRIGHGQTISQPFIVALMTDLLQPEAGDRVLEIGTGSGYQAAVLAELVESVYTIEIIPDLATTAAARLAELGYESVHVKAGDGWYGWPEEAPFDGIMVTAVSEQAPPKLVEQLAPGGRLVLPLGPQFGAQMLVVLSKDDEGVLHRRDVLPVQFVPFTRDN